MSKYICDICKAVFTDDDDAFDHVVDVHGDVIESRYILEDIEIEE